MITEWARHIAEAIIPGNGHLKMGFEEHIEVCQQEKGWKGISGRGNSQTKALSAVVKGMHANAWVPHLFLAV